VLINSDGSKIKEIRSEFVGNRPDNPRSSNNTYKIPMISVKPQTQT